MIKFFHKIFIFDVYITFVIENYVLYCLSCFIEIRYFDNSEYGREASCIISLLITCMLVIFILIGFVVWLLARNSEQYDELYYFKEYFTGIKPTN